MTSLSTKPTPALGATTLGQAPTGTRVRLQDFSCDRAATRRLRALGLTPGVELDILQHRGQGVVVAHDGNRVALGGAIAENLTAEILGQPAQALPQSGKHPV